MSISNNKTGMATYIAGSETSAWIGGLANPVKGTPEIELRNDYCDPSDYHSPVIQEAHMPSPIQPSFPFGYSCIFSNIYDDHWCE